jgi:hypothetical protein
VFKWAGRGIGSRLEKEKERGELGRRVGEEGWAEPAVWVCFFSFFFQIHFKPISNPFKFKSFTSFQILTQISPTI